MKHESDVWLAKNGAGQGKTGAPAIRLGWGTWNRRNLEVSWLPATGRGIASVRVVERHTKDVRQADRATCIRLHSSTAGLIA